MEETKDGRENCEKGSGERHERKGREGKERGKEVREAAKRNWDRQPNHVYATTGRDNHATAT